MRPYYSDSLVTLYHGDCREILPTIADASVDMVFTSPPYNLGNTAGGGFPNKRLGHYDARGGMSGRGGGGKWPGAALAFGYDEHDDNMPHAEYVAWQKETLRECWRTLSDAGAIFYNHKVRIFDGLAVTPFDYNPDLPVRQVIIWARAGGINFSPVFYCPTHEWIVLFAKPGFRLKSKGASGVGDVWYVPQEPDPEHPAPFPLALPARAIETTDAAVILDPFAGRGTTLRAAKDSRRKAIGIEKSERFCEVAARRLTQEVLELGA